MSITISNKQGRRWLDWLLDHKQKLLDGRINNPPLISLEFAMYELGYLVKKVEKKKK